MKIKRSAPFILILLLITTPPLRSEYLFLTDGSIIKGSIIKETLDVVTFRAEQGRGYSCLLSCAG